MRIELKNELPFIMKKGILSGNVEHLGGNTYVFRSLDGSFKQVLKKPEYEQMVKLGEMKETPKKEEKPTPTREEELNAMEIEEVLEIAKEMYTGVDKDSEKEELIVLILDAEKDDKK